MPYNIKDPFKERRYSCARLDTIFRFDISNPFEKVYSSWYLDDKIFKIRNL